MAATGLQVNWTAVSFNSITIERVDSVSMDEGGKLLTYKGDGDTYASVAANYDNNPKVTIKSSDVATVHSFGNGTQATFTATHKDALGAVGGAIVWTMVNATVDNANSQGAHAAFGDGTLSLMGVSADGVTNPLSYTRT